MNPASGKATEEAMENLKIDSSTKTSKLNSFTKEGSSSGVSSGISTAEVSSPKNTEVKQESPAGDQGHYDGYSYIYPGMDGSFAVWDSNGYLAGVNGIEMHPMVSQADNGSYIYYPPGFETGYYSYSPLMSGVLVGPDGQYIGQMPMYPSVLLPSAVQPPGYFPQAVAYGSELSPTYTWDPYYYDGFQGNAFVGDFINPSTPNVPSSYFGKFGSKDLHKSKSADRKASLSRLNLLPASAHTLKSDNKAGAALSKDPYPVSKFSLHSLQTNQGKGALLYPNRIVNPKEMGRNWNGSEKLKSRNKLQGSGDDNLLNGIYSMPRSNNLKDDSVNSVGLLSKLKNDDMAISKSELSNDMYNLPDFSTKYEHALFFVIKSYSEDDIHKSIKYNVWASTPNGNKKLDAAYRAAQEKTAEKGINCPIFLFFSVNASGQFCGVAEMIGPVDFSKSMEFWQQDKWTGYLPVKWHIIKDIPNPQFRHIILENNENKPVTNSRDTQEVKFLQGTEMLNIFKNFSAKTSILDDFDFYESRQKSILERRSKLSTMIDDRLLPNNDKMTLSPEEGTDHETSVDSAPRDSTDETCAADLKRG